MFTRNGLEFEPTQTNEKGVAFVRRLVPCKRCGGSGHYAHNGEHDRCYRCNTDRAPLWHNGVSSEWQIDRLYTAEQLAKLNARRDALRAKKAAKDAAALVAKLAAEEAARMSRAIGLQSDPLFLTLKKYEARSAFLADLLRRYRIADLSEKQVAAIDATVAKLAKTDALAASSQFLGAEGERVPVAGVVTLVRCIHQSSGGYVGGIPDVSRYLVKIETDNGSVVVWFTANPPAKEGERVNGSATVKAQSVYQGVNQTTVKNFRAAKVKAT